MVTEPQGQYGKVQLKTIEVYKQRVFKTVKNDPFVGRNIYLTYPLMYTIMQELDFARTSHFQILNQPMYYN